LTDEPQSRRLFHSPAIVGYQEAQQWLENSTGDLLLIGQPGSGKTSLLQYLARKKNCKFISGSDEAQLWLGINIFRPSILIVDDAHLHRATLQSLLRLRQQPNHSFRIAASCWPSERPEIKTLLHIPDTQILELQPLSRDEIVAILKGVGLTGNRELIR